MATSNTSDTPCTPAAAPETASNAGQSVREATVWIGDANLTAVGIADLIAVWRRAGLQAFELLATDQRGAVVQLEVADPLPADHLAASNAVGRWERVSTVDDHERYVLEVTAPTFPPSLADTEVDLFGIRDVTVTAHGLTIALVGTHPAIAAVIDEYERLGLAPDLQTIGPYAGTEWTLDALTARQREVVTTAYELGYYDVPRATTTDAVAAELGVDASTVTEHLQRAERNLLDRHLSD